MRIGILQRLSKMQRYFIAVPLPESVRERLVSIQPVGIPGMRLTPKDHFHLTLHFLGNLTDGTATQVHDALKAVVAPSFKITLIQPGLFSSEGKPCVLWIGVEESGPLRTLHTSVGTALTRTIGFQPEQRPYSPHVTLARLNDTCSMEAINQYLRETSFTAAGIAVKRFALFSSHQEQGTWRYREEADFPLD